MDPTGEALVVGLPVCPISPGYSWEERGSRRICSGTYVVLVTSAPSWGRTNQIVARWTYALEELPRQREADPMESLLRLRFDRLRRDPGPCDLEIKAARLNWERMI